MLISEHTGTHLDPPYHYDADGPSIDQLPLSSLVKRARVLDLTHKLPREGIGAADLEVAARRDGITLGPDDAAVIWTGHSRNFGQESYLFERPFIAADGADWIVAKAPGMVVTDLIGLDEPTDPTSPIHNRFLRNGIPQLQITTNLHRLTEGEANVLAFPLKLVGGTGSPLRAFAALV
jgi:kynurenine formamidase